MSENKAGIIHAQIAKVMLELAPIVKGRKANGATYNYRGIDDVYNALQPLMAKHGISDTPTVLEDEMIAIEKNGKPWQRARVKVYYKMYAEDGSFVEGTTIGVSDNPAEKAMVAAQSVAHRIFILQLFKVPTDEIKDIEALEPSDHIGAPPPPPDDNKYTPEQMKLIQVLFTKFGIDTPEAKRAYIGHALGRHIASAKDINKLEATLVIDSLNSDIREMEGEGE